MKARADLPESEFAMLLRGGASGRRLAQRHSSAARSVLDFSKREHGARRAKAGPGRSAQPAEALHGVSGRRCMITGKVANKANRVTFSGKRHTRHQRPNLQYKWIFWEREERWIRLRLSAKGMKTIEKLGLDAAANRAGLDLYSLNYRDGSSARKEWKDKNNAHGTPPKLRPSMRHRTTEQRPFIPAWKREQLEKMSAGDAENEKNRWLAKNSRLYKKQLREQRAAEMLQQEQQAPTAVTGE